MTNDKPKPHSLVSNSMITIVVGTNRQEAISRVLANIYQVLLTEQDAPSQVVDLHELPSDFLSTALYENNGQNEVVNRLKDKLAESDKVVFIVPEYNNSFPGILKIFIDAMPYPSPLQGKKCALVGLSAGVQGGGLALSHFTDVLNYLGAHVLAAKPKLAFIQQHLQEDMLTNKLYRTLLEEQVEQLITF